MMSGMQNMDFLKALLTAAAPSGFESRAARVWADEARGFSSVRGDGFGNVYAGINPDRELSVMLCGHLDEIGLMVSHHDHHRHSAYLLTHVDAPGFSQSQQRRVAEMVLGQRGGLRKLEPQLASETFAWQVLCLRLAVVKCHARGEVNPQALTLRTRQREALLGYAGSWAESHPRTVFLLQEEATVWVRNGPLRLVLPG